MGCPLSTAPARLVPAGPRLQDCSGKTAPSFIATVGAIVLLVAGYLLWDIYRPNPVARSEQVVREFARAAAAEVGPLRRALREQIRRYEADPDTLEDVREAIEELAQTAREKLDELADAAYDEIDMMDGISMRTQDNRLSRLRQRKAEAESRINSLVDEARLKLPSRRSPDRDGEKS